MECRQAAKLGISQLYRVSAIPCHRDSTDVLTLEETKNPASLELYAGHNLE